MLRKTSLRRLGRVIEIQVAGPAPNLKQVIKVIGIFLERELLRCTCHPSSDNY